MPQNRRDSFKAKNVKALDRRHLLVSIPGNSDGPFLTLSLCMDDPKCEQSSFLMDVSREVVFASRIQSDIFGSSSRISETTVCVCSSSFDRSTL